MKAAIYFRVSTDNQEQESTSLQTQQEACLKYCKDKGYDVAHQFRETYSGLTLDRPKLNELRELVRNEQIDVIVCYCLDRLSRDPTHGVILTQELEKHHVALEAVTEDVDNSELGKLISYIRGFSAKLEAEKIRERSLRGKRMRVLSGRLACGGGVKLYGYDYVSGKGVGEGIRIRNESEAQWVRKIFQWYGHDYLTLNSIVHRLYSLKVPSPTGKEIWGRSTLQKMLRNTGYKGQTYAYTQARAKSGNKYLIERPKEDWIPLESATPPLISGELFDSVQARLQRNKELAPRNTKREYLLRGFVYCNHCGRRYSGATRANKTKNGINRHRFYHCSRNTKKVFIDPCHNRTWSADNLEKIVWNEIESTLSNPKTVLAGLEVLQSESQKTNEYLKELDIIEAKLKHMEKEKDRAWKAYRITGDEAKFSLEIKDVMTLIEGLERRQEELENRIDTAKQADASIDGIKQACELVKSNLRELSFENMRFTLETLQIKVWIDKDYLKLDGVIPIVSTTSIRHGEGRLSWVCR
ncbi:recombinase family protein [Chloroflexota bacterium]